MAITKVIEEKVDVLSVTWSFQAATELTELEYLVSEYSFLTDKYNINFLFYQNDSVIDEAKSWKELVAKLNSALWEDDDRLRVSLSLDKTTYPEFIIVDQSSFLGSLPKSPEKIIKFWDSVFSKYKTLTIFSKSYITITFPSFDKLQATSLFNDLEISNSVSITPENLFNLSEQLKVYDVQLLHHHLNVVTSIFCLKLFCSKYRELSDIQFIFEGYNSCAIENPSDEDLIDVSDTLYTIYQWIFSDSNISSKLGILRNLVSLSNNRELGACFSHNLLKSLFSNYQVYMKENVKQYFEIKNKVTEFMFDLLNKSFEICDQYKMASRNTVLAVLSYFFTVVVIRAINKQKLDVLFTAEIASISVVFILSAIIYVFIVHSDLIKKNQSIKLRIKELRGRYEQVLCEDEVEELFNSESLSISLADNSTTKYHSYVLGVLVILLICVLYFSISNLGLKYFVELFSYT
jgi:hypothetical protein